MRIQRAELAVYNARAVDLLNRWQEDRVSCGDVDAIARPQPNSMAALLGYEAEAIPFGLEDPPCIRRAIERFGAVLRRRWRWRSWFSSPGPSRRSRVFRR